MIPDVDRRKRDGTFARGNIPWNARRPGRMRPNTGSFSPGHRRNPSSPLFSVSLRGKATGSAELYVKVPTPARYASLSRREPTSWVPAQRWVWETVHGPVPAGMVVLSLPGPLDVNVDRLVLVDRAELAMLNKARFGSLPADLDVRRAAVARARLVALAGRRRRKGRGR